MSDAFSLQLSVVIPVFNEEHVLPELFARLSAVFDSDSGCDWRAVFVNDGSRDNTGEILDELTRVYPEHFRVVHHEVNRGYGGALRDVRTDDLAAHPLKTLVARNPSVDWNAVDDCIMGAVAQQGTQVKW